MLFQLHWGLQAGRCVNGWRVSHEESHVDKFADMFLDLSLILLQYPRSKLTTCFVYFLIDYLPSTSCQPHLLRQSLVFVRRGSSLAPLHSPLLERNLPGVLLLSFSFNIPVVHLEDKNTR